jgi:hypothetical protein
LKYLSQKAAATSPGYELFENLYPLSKNASKAFEYCTFCYPHSSFSHSTTLGGAT